MRKTIAILEKELIRETKRADDNARDYNLLKDQDRVLRESFGNSLGIGSYSDRSLDWRKIVFSVGKLMGKLEYFNLRDNYDKVVIERDNLIEKYERNKQ